MDRIDNEDHQWDKSKKDLKSMLNKGIITQEYYDEEIELMHDCSLRLAENHSNRIKLLTGE